MPQLSPSQQLQHLSPSPLSPVPLIPAAKATVPQSQSPSQHHPVHPIPSAHVVSVTIYRHPSHVIPVQSPETDSYPKQIGIRILSISHLLMNYRSRSHLALHHPIKNRYRDLHQKTTDIPPTRMTMHIRVVPALALVYPSGLERERGRGVLDLGIVRGYPNTTLSVPPGKNRTIINPVIRVVGPRLMKTNRVLRK